MLYLEPEVISPNTLNLLHRLSKDTVTDGFRLVGGTSLALQYGHRLSIDLDFFGPDEFSSEELARDLNQRYGLIPVSQGKNTLIGIIEGVKVDFIRHPYPWLTDPIVYEDSLLATDFDIAAMKVNAIVNSGERVKNFYDVYFLLERFSLGEIVDAYERKYAHANGMIAMKALTYFGDIDPDRDPVVMVKKLPFKQVTSRIEKAALNLSQKF